MPIPRNLVLLGTGEQELRRKAEALIARTPSLLDHVDLMERCMDLLDVLRQHHVDSDDARTVASLGLRSFNSFASSWKLAVSGYYQTSALILRDIVETTYLVDLFHKLPPKIELWRNADERTLKREFSPAAVRKALDEQAGMGRSRREEIYKRFCNLAAHPTVLGFAMLRPMGMDAVAGPFFDPTALKAILEEIGSLSAQCGFVFGVHLNTDTAACSAVLHRFIQGAMDYSSKYIGKSYSQAEKDEVDRIFRMDGD